MIELHAALAAPFPADRVSWRVGTMTKDKSKAMALAYIDARDVMQRLDEECGAGGWQCRYIAMSNGTTCCEIGIRVDGEWIWKSNGAGATDVEAEKGAYSDAFKRAAVLWGIGRYLYDLDSPWVRINEWKQIEKDELPRLRSLLGGGGAKMHYAAPAPKGKAASRPEYQRIAVLMQQASSVDDLAMVWKAEQHAIWSLPEDWRMELTAMKDDIKGTLAARAA